MIKRCPQGIESCSSVSPVPSFRKDPFTFSTTALAPSALLCQVDLWSVGVITYILLSGSMPFDPASYSAESLQRTDALDFPSALFSDVSAQALDFIRALLQVDPRKRLTAAAALNHTWVLSCGDAADAAAAAAAAARAADAAADADAAAAAAAAAYAAAQGKAPTPRTPRSAQTPLMTPGRLKALKASGALKNGWNRAAEKYKSAGETSGAVGSEGEQAREMAHKRTADELADNADVPTLMLPPEVSKRIRKAASDSASSAASNSDTRESLR